MASKFDFAAVTAWRIERAVNAATDGIDDGRTTKDEADRRRAVANAIVAEIEADEKLGSVVKRADVETVTDDFTGSIRTALAPVASQVAGPIAAMTDPTEIRDLVSARINDAFRVAQAAFQRGSSEEAALSPA